MGTPKTRKRKRKGRIKVKTGAAIVKKDSVRNDAMPRMETQMPRTNGAVLKVKVKKR